MESLRRLAPPSTTTGPVTHIEVSGSMLGHPRQPYRLTQQTAKRIRTLLSTINKGQDIRLKVFEGRIRSLDLDLLTLTLRNAKAEPAEVSLTLDDDTFYEAARDAHYHELGVRVAARSLDAKTWTLVDLEFSPHLDQAAE